MGEVFTEKVGEVFMNRVGEVFMNRVGEVFKDRLSLTEDCTLKTKVSVVILLHVLLLVQVSTTVVDMGRWIHTTEAWQCLEEAGSGARGIWTTSLGERRSQEQRCDRCWKLQTFNTRCYICRQQLEARNIMWGVKKGVRWRDSRSTGSDYDYNVRVIQGIR